jgi:hypothetical protein
MHTGNYFRRTTIGLLAAITLAACSQKPEVAPPDASKDKEALAAGVEAATYGFPLVIMDATRRKLTNVAAPGPTGAPINQFQHMTQFPDATFKDVVRANVDTLYSSAWLDLSKEPIVLSVPDTHGRFYLMPMIDAWTNIFASPGKRTTGTKAQSFAVTGPNWTGTLPKGLQELKSPTNMVWIIGRTQTNGPKDYAAVHAIQKEYKLVPLSAFGKPYTAAANPIDPTVDMKKAPIEVVADMSTSAYFNAMAALLKDNPAPSADAPVLAKLAKLGIVPGEKFDPAKLDPAVVRGLDQALPGAIAKLTAASKSLGAGTNGWNLPPMTLANFGADYGLRAMVALAGLGANLAADAVYPTAFKDSEDHELNGAHRYVVHFDKGQEPPVRAFWSLTMYDPDSFFVPNALNRYALSSWMPLRHNADGSLDLYVQADSPGKDKIANWLPCPPGAFNITLRLYWPNDKAPSIMDGSWQLPGIKKIS